MNLLQLKWYAVESARKNPTLRDEIYDIVELAISEIEEGGSEQHECSLAQRDIEELINTMKVEESNSTGGDKTVYGYSNLETHTMISHIHNDQLWLEDAWENISEYDNPMQLGSLFTQLVFNNGGLSDVFGKMSFERINWIEIFDNLKGMMPKIRFEVGDYLMIVDGDDLTFDWKGKVFVFDSYDGNKEGAIDITDHSGEDVQHYQLFEHRFVKVQQFWELNTSSDRWISVWVNQNVEIVGINYFQGHDSFNDLQEDFFLPDPQLTEKVLAKNMKIDDAIWLVLQEENVSKEELLERLALANGQAKRLFDLLHDLQTNCQGYGSLEEEMSRIHNIKLLTNVSTDEWKYQD